MAYPEGLTQATITIGSSIDWFGQPAKKVEALVTPVVGKGLDYLVHRATGATMVVTTKSFDDGGSGTLSFKLPHVDQPGWADGAGNDATMWAYKIGVTVRLDNGSSKTWEKNVQPLVGQETIDLDLVPDGPIADALFAPIAPVTSVNGQTGDIWISGDGTSIDPVLVERINALESKADFDATSILSRLDVLERENDEILDRLDIIEETPAADPYDDAELAERVRVLESDTALTERLEQLEAEDEGILSRLDTIESTPGAVPYDDTALTQRVSFLEEEPEYDDTQVLARLESLESVDYALKSELYDDTALTERVEALETEPDVDLTPYALKTDVPEPFDAGPLTSRVKTLEDQPAPDLTPYALKTDVPETFDAGPLTSRVKTLEDQSSSSVEARSISYPSYWGHSYWQPDPADDTWAKSLSRPGVDLVVINPNTGPGADALNDWVIQSRIARESGARTIGYVSTNYADAGTAREVGSRGHSVILDEISKHVSWYGMQGVFLDEVSNGWNEAQQDDHLWYRDLIEKIRAQHGKSFVIVGNAGAVTTDAYPPMFDILVTFESSAAEYLSSPLQDLLPPHYRRFGSSKFWHMIHDVESPEQAESVLDRARGMNVGHLFLTDDSNAHEPPAQWGNPYDALPADWLLKAQLDWVNDIQAGYDDAALKSRVSALETGKAESSHTHDERYYTEAEVNSLLANRPQVLILGPNDPIPAGTPEGTLIGRTD